MPRRKRKPRYCHHKPTGQAYVRINGRCRYLGKWQSDESKRLYDAIVHECLDDPDLLLTGEQLTIDELCIAYINHAERYYRKNGEITSEVHRLRSVLRLLVQEFGETKALGFGPMRLKQLRKSMLRKGWCRKTINDSVHRVRRMFRWATSEELMPPNVLASLKAVEALKRGRTEAHDYEPVSPVDDEIVDKTLPHLPPVVADMVRLQLLTGARPGEICAMRPCDVTHGIDGIWIYRPQRHKTEHHGKERRIFIGPRGQAILKTYLERDPEVFCFSPADSERQRNSRRKTQRMSPMTPSQATRVAKGRKLRDHYTKDAYNRAIKRACEAAFDMPAELRNITRTLSRMENANDTEKSKARKRLSAEASEWRRKHYWSPNQLRHTRATELREQFGIEAAQVVLGHSDPKTTLVYAETQFSKAAEIARETG